MRLARIALFACGISVLGYGLIGSFTGPNTEPLGQFGFMAALVAAHEFLLIPLVLAAGAVLARYLRPPVRGLIQGGLIISLAVSLMALPLVLGYGRRPDDPSALPLNYGLGLAIVLSYVWAVTGGLIIMRVRKERRLK